RKIWNSSTSLSSYWMAIHDSNYTRMVKQELRSFFQNLKKIQAGSDGIVLESFEQQMSKTRDLFQKATISKRSGSIVDKNLIFNRDNSLGTATQLSHWHRSYVGLIKKMAKKPNSTGHIALEHLKSSGQIKLSEFQKME
ncbi:MAG: hypothetical protein ACI9FN_001356, partial [Saprospiraceae bacterium]